MFNLIKNFLKEGGRCLLIENDKPIGVVLTIEEYELLRSKTSSSASAPQSGATADKEKSLFSETDLPSQTLSYQGGDKGEVASFPEASAEIADIEATDDVTLEDLGVDELPY